MTTTFATTAPTATNDRAINWGRYALVGLATIVAANVANLIVYFIGGALVAYDPQFPPLANPVGTLFFTTIPAVGAVILYAILLRFARRPARIFAIIAAATFIVTLIPDFTYAPALPGASGGQIAALVLMHAVAAAVITTMLTRLARR